MRNEWKIYFRVRDKKKVRMHQKGAVLSLINVEVPTEYLDGIFYSIKQECERLSKIGEQTI